jgi:Fe-S-cluster-containing hydrogenase component 2/thioredoxin reductase/CRP-like cAMP-binding protein
MDAYQIAIIGAGPAGLSAAGRAAERDRLSQRSFPSYILLEGFEASAKTIRRYQKGKLVLAEPGFLDLRSDFAFAVGSREQILESWDQDLRKLGVNIRTGAEVLKVAGRKGAFTIALASGETLAAENVILAIGLEGNPRRLGVPGSEIERVQYQLDDPRAYRDEVIVVVGAGDSAIENAVALAEQNQVIIVNRGKEFSRAKDRNVKAVIDASADPSGRFICQYEASVKSVAPGDGQRPLTVVLQTHTGERPVLCDRVIARLGAIPPRKFVESIGIRFPNDRPEAIPELTRQYESNVPGVYVIGALAGYPLIKQAMNQGYDVVEFISGNDIRPADHPLLEYQFNALPFDSDADEVLERMKAVIPMFHELNALAFRELVIESTVTVAYPDGAEYREALGKERQLEVALMDKKPRPRSTRVIREGDVIYSAGEFGSSFFTIVQGEVRLEPADPNLPSSNLGRGEFFGETSLLSGRPRSERAVAGAACLVVETPRRTMLKLMSSNETVRSGVDWIFVARELQRTFAPQAPRRQLRDLAARVTLKRLDAGAVIFREGEAGDCLYLVRAGAITLSRKMSGTNAETVVGESRSGELFGQLALLGERIRHETAVASIASELLEIKSREFLELTKLNGARLDLLQKETSRQALEGARLEVRPEAASVMNFLMKEGLGEATNVLVINESLCVGCDNCEKACAETHAGISRLDREAGASFAKGHIPISCRHCERPHCMKDCPPNAIRRAPTGEVFIDDSCIGCGNCQTNCPYGVIRLEYQAPKKPSLLSWLFFGAGSGPGEEKGYHPTAAAKAKGKKAVKCDACVGLSGGPACVRACPTGAAIRLGPERFVDLIEEPKR